MRSLLPPHHACIWKWRGTRSSPLRSRTKCTAHFTFPTRSPDSSHATGRTAATARWRPGSPSGAVAGTRSRTWKELDLLLGLGAKDAFRFFADHVVRRYNADPGFTTMNLPRLLDTLEDVGVVAPIVCANMNSIGFRMCGGRALYEEPIATRRFSSHSHVGARIRSAGATGGHRLCVPAAEYSFDRIRRIQQG